MRQRITVLAALAITLCLAAWQPLLSRAAAPHHHGSKMSGGMSREMSGRMGMRGGMGMGMMTPHAKQLRHHLDADEAAAARHGKYACCIKPSCDWCMTHMGACTCYKGVAMGMGACRECHGGWEAGQGRVPGKTKDDVRGMKTIRM